MTAVNVLSAIRLLMPCDAAPTPFQSPQARLLSRGARHAARCSRNQQEDPRGYRSFADQLLRAAGETVALIGEGANRFTKGQKRQRFTEARGEAGEVAVHVEAIRAMDLICEADAERLLGRADRVCAMLTRLIHIHS
jgi:four helix bundle protein